MFRAEMQSARLAGEEDSAAYEQAAGGEHSPGPPLLWTDAMNDHDWEQGEAPGGGEQMAPEDGAETPGELLRKLSALNLAGQEVAPIREYSEERRGRNHVDARYPEPLSTEGSPRRRARSLPWNAIPEAEVEDDDDSLMCCCKLKKRVQFADSIGLSLASIKHFLPSEEPTVPPAVLARLQSYPPTVPELHLPEEMCVTEGPLPAELLARLEQQRVCLEQVSASLWGVRGYVLVKDPADGAQVKVRYTFNEWQSFLDCPASAAQQSSASDVQRFHFNLCYPPFTTFIHFAICLTTCQGQEIWDNNQGANYAVSCQQGLPSEVLPSSPKREGCEGPQLW